MVPIQADDRHNPNSVVSPELSNQSEGSQRFEHDRLTEKPTGEMPFPRSAKLAVNRSDQHRDRHRNQRRCPPRQLKPFNNSNSMSQEANNHGPLRRAINRQQLPQMLAQTNAIIGISQRKLDERLVVTLVVPDIETRFIG